MANKMADKKKNASRVQQVSEPAVEARARTSTKETPARAARETRKEQPKQESRPTRRETKGPTLQARLRNNRIGRFIFEAYYELRHKVTWPTFNEARNMTFMVLLLSAVVAIILALADFGLYHLFLLISGGS
ncbi:MAG TPA: preprotein translocase subunit SecE [Ktedonobacteraceae bacterium]|nr:preprotein translocase subunit SecE [Ktedonobacteraceae bacterium]